MIHFVDGQFILGASIPVNDLGLMRGLAVFEYLRTYQGRPFHLGDHLQRLEASAHAIGISLPYTLEEIAAIVETLIEKNRFPETAIKIFVTGGESRDQIWFEGKARLIVTAAPFETPLLPSIHVVTTQHRRILPRAKTTCYVPALLALKEAKDQGAHDALFIGPDGEILESTMGNFFGVQNGVLVTPSSEELLLGITRSVVLKLADQVEEKPLFLRDTFEEAFLTSSSKEILPITSLNQKPLPIGPLTLHLQAKFREYVRGQAWKPLHIPFKIKDLEFKQA